MRAIWPSEKHNKWFRTQEVLQVPLPLRNAASKLMKDLDYGKGYEYAHDHDLKFC